MILDNLFTLTEGKKDPDELAKYEHDVTTLLAMGDVKTAKKVAGLSPDAAHRNRLRNIIRRHENNQGVAEGMPASVIKSKQRYAEMTPAEFAKAHGNKSDEELQAMAWRHGYGKSSNHYVDKRNKGRQGVAEGSMPYPHGKPEAGDKITWYHSNHYPSIEGTVVGWKDGHLIVKSIDPSPRNTEKTVVKYRVPKNNILSVEKQGVAEGEQSGLLEKQDACYHKVRSRYKVWPSAYASGALVQCRKKGAANWGTGGKKK